MGKLSSVSDGASPWLRTQGRMAALTTAAALTAAVTVVALIALAAGPRSLSLLGIPALSTHTFIYIAAGSGVATATCTAAVLVASRHSHPAKPLEPASTDASSVVSSAQVGEKDNSKKPELSLSISPRAELFEKKHTQAAIKIQRMYRRVWSHALQPSIVDCAAQLESETPVAEGTSGKTSIKVLKGPNVIVKLTKSQVGERRMKQMRKAQQICRKSRYRHLVIPKVGMTKEGYLVEEKVPIDIHATTKTQIGLYVTHREAFTGAVQEFVGFLFQAKLTDITSTGQFFQKFAGKDVEIGRFDNIPLYLENGVGKIALIDLEHFSPRDSVRSHQDSVSICALALSLFPLHFKEIIEAAQKIDPTIFPDEELLIREKDVHQKFVDNVFVKHRDFLEKKGISSENPAQIVALSKEREGIIVRAVGERVRKLHNKELVEEGVVFGAGCLGEADPEKQIKILEEKTPEVIKILYKRIQAFLEKRLGEHSKLENIWDFVGFRTLSFEGLSIQSIQELLADVPVDKEEDEITPFIELFSTFVLEAILTEMVGEEVYYYNPRMQGNTQLLCL